MAKNRVAGLIKASTTAVDMPTPYRPSKDEQAQRRRYAAEDALRTITRAEEIRKDRTLMSDVRKVAHEQVKNLQCVTKPKRK